MKISRKNFLRLTSVATASLAIETALTACGGGASASSGETGATGAPGGTSGGDGGSSAVTGAWSNPETWGGVIPTSSDPVTIAAGQLVILDTAASCASLSIQGTLVADLTKSISLTTGYVTVGAAGVWNIGTEGAPYPASHICTITLNGAESSRVARSVSATQLGFANTGVGRSIQVQPGGRLSFIGTAPAIRRTKLNARAQAGATTFSLADATGWKAGDEIAVGTTDFFEAQTPNKLMLASNASGTDITTTTGISSERWGELQYVTDSGMSRTHVPPETLTSPPAGAPTTLDERAFVIHLTRNIVVQGADDSHWSDRKFGAHCMFMGRNSLIQLDGVQFRRVGQAGAIGRYPIHWHMMSYNMPAGMDAPSDGVFLGAVVGNHYVKNCAIEQSSQRMIVIHGTHGITCDNNVGYDITGHAIFLEDGSEQDNIVTNNAVIKVRAPTNANKLYNHDTPSGPLNSEYIGVYGINGTAGIWFTNPKNTLTGNWVNNSEGCGIWHAFANKCFGLSDKVEFSLLKNSSPPRNMAPYDFVPTAISDNWSYGNKGIGIQTNRPQINDKGDTSDSTTYQGSFINNPITGLKIFKNGAGGYSNRVLEAKYQTFVCADNAGMDVFGQAQTETSIAMNFLNVAESLNNATSRVVESKRAAYATYHETLNFQNCIAVGFKYISGEQFNKSSVFTGGGLFRLDDLYTSSIFTFSANTGIKQIDSSPTYRTRPPNIDISPPSVAIPGTGYSRNWTLAGAIKDVNGLFGPVGKYWIFNDPFFTYGLSGSSNVPAGGDSAGSNGVYTDDRFFGVTPTWHTDDSGADFQIILPILVEQQDTGGITKGTWEIGDGAISPVLGWMRHFAVRNGGRYKVSFPGHIATTVAEFKVSLMDDVNDIFLLGVEFSGTVTAKVIQRAQQFNSRTGGVPYLPNGTENGIAQPLTPAGSFTNVVADTTGTIFWQDKPNNIVWFKVRVNSLVNAFGSSYSNLPSGTYKQVAIAVTS
jgi:hypothetical protein